MRAFPVLWGSAVYLAFAFSRYAWRGDYTFRHGVYGALIYLAMAGQLICLALSGQLSLGTGLPLHLCSFSGVLALPALLFRWPGAARFLNRLGRIGALAALLFPAPLQTAYPYVSDALFFFLHALLLFLPLRENGGTRGAMALTVLLVALAWAADAAFGANYLFLRRLPAGVPLDDSLFQTQGQRVLLIAGLMLFMLIPDESLFRGGNKYK